MVLQEVARRRLANVLTIKDKRKLCRPEETKWEMVETQMDTKHRLKPQVNQLAKQTNK